MGKVRVRFIGKFRRAFGDPRLETFGIKAPWRQVDYQKGKESPEITSIATSGFWDLEDRLGKESCLRLMLLKSKAMFG
ncbi:hypothetical protein GH714_031636 [Hevea brasiliensis]|uniref:Uncharacterized protein n=1 Tax=Hevea brasiliensis TaxID=3981 RepID=A0A6A6LD50_HEVBR|nr:hypothetical protein GH714_031636 [Hevea brasiliensis]